jgi:hypothetical protein
MIKCYFVDVRSIKSEVPRSNFIESDLEKIADSILEMEGLIRPLILQEISFEKYTVIEGHQEYYAAVIAKEKNISKAEMVNAFIIQSNARLAAIEQLNLLRQPLPNTVVNPTLDRHILTEVLSSTIDRLLPSISAAISTQLEPIVLQLAEQKQILDTIKKLKRTPNTTEGRKKTKAEDTLSTETVAISEPPQQPGIIVDRSVEATKTETKKAATKSRKKPKPEDTLPTPNLESVESPQQPDLIVASFANIAKPTEANKIDNSPESIDLDKPTNALNLINTLDPAQLKMKLERSGIATSKTSVKLVETIITNRSIQPAQKFESWDAILNAKIGGLTAAIIKKIIDKLK